MIFKLNDGRVNSHVPHSMKNYHSLYGDTMFTYMQQLIMIVDHFQCLHMVEVQTETTEMIDEVAPCHNWE